MKIRNRIYTGLLLSALALSGATSCSSDGMDHDKSVIIPSKSLEADSINGKPTFTSWLKESYLKPYNISVLYKFEDSQSDHTYNLVPANKNLSVQLAHLVKFMCIEPYDVVTGSKEFIRGSFPKELVFIGSSGINPNGTEIQGVAEGGRKITLYKVNSLNRNNIVTLNEDYFHTIHHEYTHIQNQIKSYPNEFKTISGKDYVSGAWSDAATYGTPSDIKDTVRKQFETDAVKEMTDILPRMRELQAKLEKGENLTTDEEAELERIRVKVKEFLDNPKTKEEIENFQKVITVLSSLTTSEVNALRKGFISPYGSSNDIEDFAELQAFYITNETDVWSGKMLIAGTEGAAKINTKLNIVKSYLKSAWNIDLDALRNEVAKRVPMIEGLDLDTFYTNK